MKQTQMLEQHDISINEPLYEGDRGDLTFEQRQLLVLLLKGPYLLRSERPNVWNVLLMSKEVVDTVLSNLFLELVVDDDIGVAFCRQANTGELEAPQLLRQLSLSYLDSVLLLEPRQRLLSAEVKGEKALIALETVEELLKSFDPTSKSNERLFKSHVQAILKRLQTRKILKKVGDNTHLYEICTVLKLLFNVEEIVQLTQAYKQKAKRDFENQFDAEDLSTQEEEL